MLSLGNNLPINNKDDLDKSSDDTIDQYASRVCKALTERHILASSEDEGAEDLQQFLATCLSIVTRNHHQ
jgi:hypothetical protein